MSTHEPSETSPFDTTPVAARGLLPEQRDFVDAALLGHALLVAGPGTGKTFALAEVSRALVDNNGVPEEEVIVVTLTRSMAATLASRIPHGRASTLHSFALYHLNRLGDAWGRRVADEWEVENLVYEDIQVGVHEYFGYRPNRRQVAEFFRRMGTAFRQDQQEPTDLNEAERQLLMVFRQHRHLLRYCLMDELVYDLLRVVEQGAQLSPSPRYVLVDEYQDLTAGELRLVQVLAERGASVVACGDDRQSIYGFREADPLALHRFPEVYGVPPRYLWRSRRCPRRVCEFAEAVASILPPLGGLERPPLESWPGRADEGEVRVISAPSPIGEARWVVRECARLVEDGVVRPEEIMVVVAFYFEPVFDNLKRAAEEVPGLPFGFYDPTTFDPAAEDRAVRLLAAGARLLVDSRDLMAWRTLAWTTPQLGPERMRRILTADQGDFLRNLEAIAGRDRVCARTLTAGLTLLERLQQQDQVEAREIVEHLRAELGLQAPLDLSRLPVLNETDITAEPARWVQAVVELSQKIQVDPDSRPAEIPVRTIFGAKGLEAEVVFLVNAMEQSFTGRGSVADGVRRLYVAATRAKQRLFISAPRNLRGDRLHHVVGARAAGLADIITTSATAADIPITRLG